MHLIAAPKLLARGSLQVYKLLPSRFSFKQTTKQRGKLCCCGSKDQKTRKRPLWNWWAPKVLADVWGSKFEAQLFHALVNSVTLSLSVKPMLPYVVGNLFFVFSHFLGPLKGAWTPALFFFFLGGDLLQVGKNHPSESMTVRSYFMIMQVELVSTL